MTQQSLRRRVGTVVTGTLGSDLHRPYPQDFELTYVRGLHGYMASDRAVPVEVLAAECGRPSVHCDR